MEPSKRPKPHIIENISLLKRKEQSIYKPSDLWTVGRRPSIFEILSLEEDKMLSCYVKGYKLQTFTSHSNYTLKRSYLKMGNRQYAEILVNGKTGSRHVPLIDCFALHQGLY